jgi:DNA polymerase III delta prime subunit
MFFIDKYIPKSESELFFHRKEFSYLKDISNDESIPHLIFYGPIGIGKKTLCMIFLQLLFGDEILDVKNIKYTVSGSGNKESDEYFTESRYHIEINPKGTNNDRYLIQDVVKKYATRRDFNFNTPKKLFKVIIINNIQNMSSLVQFSLRRTIEKYSDKCRFILISNSILKIIKPLLSRCNCIRLGQPSNKEIISYIYSIGSLEDIHINLDRLSYIINSYRDDFKMILWTLQIYKINDLYLKYIRKKLNSIINFMNLLNEKNNLIINIDTNLFDNLFDELNLTVLDLKFRYKNVNKYINIFGEKIFKLIYNHIIIPNIESVNISTLNNCRLFLINCQRDKLKKTSFIHKKRIDDELLSIRDELYDILTCIRLFDLKTDKEKIIDELVKLILEHNIGLHNEIRNIFFNMTITNFTGSEIIKCIINKLIMKSNISDKAKLEIINFASQAEFNMIKGRREINQFDMFIVNTINILK